MNVGLKRLKASLALGVKKINSPITPKIGIRVEFLDLSFFDFLDVDKFLIVLSTLLLSPLTTFVIGSTQYYTTS